MENKMIARELAQLVEHILCASATMKEKEEMIAFAQETMNEQTRKALERLHDEYEYCPFCDNWYRKDSYEMEEGTECWHICPLGHKRLAGGNTGKEEEDAIKD